MTLFEPLLNKLSQAAKIKNETSIPYVWYEVTLMMGL